jgi:transposase
MSKARLVITAVTVEKRRVSEVAHSCGVARSWVYALLARYRDEGDTAVVGGVLRGFPGRDTQIPAAEVQQRETTPTAAKTRPAASGGATRPVSR